MRSWAQAETSGFGGPHGDDETKNDTVGKSPDLRKGKDQKYQ